MKTRFQHAYVLNIMSDDHPGIVSGVSQAVFALGGNIDSCSQTVLAGYFTLIMIVSFPTPADVEKLAAAVRGHDKRDALQVVARPFSPPRWKHPQQAEQFVVTAFGDDKPGVISRLCEYLSGKDINIVDFYWSTQPAGDGSRTDFVLIGQVDLPASMDVAMLQADLEDMGREQGFTVRLQHENVFVATNQLRLPQRRQV